MFISDIPFANFWTNCSSCPELQPRIDDGPDAVCLLYRPPTCSVLTPSYQAYAVHGAGLSTALRAPICRASVLRQLKFWFVPAGFSRDGRLWRQRRITIRARGKDRAIQGGCGPSCLATHGILPPPLHILCPPSKTRWKNEPGHFSYASKTAGTVPLGLRAGAINTNIPGLPAVGISQRAKPPTRSYTRPQSFIHPSHSLPPMLPTFSPTPHRLTDLSRPLYRGTLGSPGQVACGGRRTPRGLASLPTHPTSRVVCVRGAGPAVF